MHRSGSRIVSRDVWKRDSRLWRTWHIVLAAAVADVERSRSSGTSRSRSDAETSSDGRRQHEERFRRLLVCVTRLPTDDACQSAPVLSAELVHCRCCCKCN